MVQHVLVTGGAGFIGSHLVRHLLRRQVKVTNLDALTVSGNLENLQDVEADPRYRFVRGDINDGDLAERLIRDCDGVIHLAAESHVDRSIIDAGPFVRANVLGTQSLLDAMRRIAAGGAAPPRFVHVSTDEVYGSLALEPRECQFTEDSPLSPTNPYAASKAGGDCLAQSYIRTFGLPVMITRCSNNFGSHQSPDKIIPLFITNLIEGRRVPLYGDGLHVRDWLHVEDHCEALAAVLERGRAGEIYNIGANNEWSNLDLTRQVLAILGRDESMIEYVPDRPGHDRRYAIDASKIRRELQWSPARSAWPQALRPTVEWYVGHRGWWERAKRALTRTSTGL